MKELYTINDIAQMTGLSTRTVRNYINSEVLKGEKIDGVWQFTAQEYSDFIGDRNVMPSIKAKKNAIIYDFLLDEKKKQEEVCIILDIPASDGEEAMEISGYFCDGVNSLGEGVRLGFEYHGKNARAILKGEAESVLKLAGAYFAR